MNKNLLLKITLPIVFLIGFLILALGNIASYIAVSWLEEQGLVAQIDHIELSLIEGQVSLQGLRGKNAEGRGIEVSRLFVDIRLKPLLDNTLVIEAIELSGLTLDSAGSLAGVDEVAGLNLESLLGSPAESSAVDEQSSETQPLGISIQQIRLSSIRHCHLVISDNTELCAGFDALELPGPIELAGERFAVQTNILLNDFFVADQQPVLNLKSLELESFALESLQSIKLASVSLRELSVLPIDSISLLEFSDLTGSNIALNNNNLAIENLYIGGLGLELIQSKDGSFQFQALLDRYLSKNDASASESEQGGPANQPSTGETSDAMSISLAKFELRDSNDLAFTDNSGEKPVRLGGTIDSLVVSNISTVPTQQRSVLALDLTLFNKGSIALNGTIDNLIDPRNGDIGTTIQNVDLRPVSRYVETSVGQQIKSGQLNTNVNVGLDAGNINGDVEIDLQQFRLKKTSQSKSEGLDAALGVPVNTAVNLLRSKDNSIALNVPLSGNIDNPEFDISKVITKAVSKALTTTIVNFYTPFGLLNLADSVFDITALKFEPIDFDAGSAELTDEKDSKQLEKILAMMKERPQLFVTVCGVSNAEDLKALGRSLAKKAESDVIKFTDKERKQLMELERSRSMAVISALAKQGIDTDKLVECESEFNRNGPKGVEISI